MLTLPTLDHLPAEQRARILVRAKDALGPLRLRYTPWQPTPKQEAFLRLSCREAFYGGAAGGGKSVALLAAALQYVDVPGYSALLLRKTYKDLSQPNALMDLAKQWLSGTDARWNQTEKRWTFPSGATLTFGYLQNEDDKYQYQGAAFHFIGFDEATQFTETSYLYLRSRARRPKTITRGQSADGLTAATVPIRIRAASNPGGRGHVWAAARFTIAETRPRGLIFIPAKLVDNPHLDRAEYEEMLLGLPLLERLRLMRGDWSATGTGDLFDTKMIEHVSEWSGDAAVRMWDLAATEPSATNDDPDYTVGLLYRHNRREGDFLLDDVVRGQWSPGKVEKHVAATASKDGRLVTVGIEQEPGSAGKALVAHYSRNVLRGFIVQGVRATGSKYTRAKIAAAAVDNGLVKVRANARWWPEFRDEADLFQEDESAYPHDDQIDAWSGAHALVLRGGQARSSVPRGRIPQRTLRRAA